MHDSFDKNGAIERKMSGHRGEVGELEELLCIMKEGRDDIARFKVEKKTKESGAR